MCGVVWWCLGFTHRTTTCQLDAATGWHGLPSPWRVGAVPRLRQATPVPVVPSRRPAGGFPGNSLLFFLASLLIVAAGILLFTLAGDVETKLGAGSDVAGSAALPVAYHRVPGAERRPLASLSNKGAQQALEEVHRQQVEQQGQQQQQRGGAAANPFDIAAGRRGGGAAAPGGFEPLPAAEESWPAETPAGDGSTASSPAALMVAAPPGTAEVGERLAKRSSLELELEESHR